MRAKKTPKTPRRSLRYLLYADKTLQKISLRRLSARARKATKSAPARRAKKTTAPSRPPAAQGMDPWWIAFGAVCAVGVVAMIGFPSGSKRPDPTSAVVASDVTEPVEDAALAPVDNRKSLAKPSTKTVSRSPSVGAVSPRTTDSTSAPARSTEAPATPSVQSATLVTIQGCLENRNDGFWLKDTSGDDAPKSRSWRSGFLKKHSASVEVVDPSNALRMAKYVGQRVAATGTVADRRMEAHSLRPVSTSCN